MELLLSTLRTGVSLLRKMKRNLLMYKYFKGIKDLPADRNYTIVINTARDGQLIELYLGYILSRRGHKVYILLDDNLLKHTDTAQIHKVKLNTSRMSRIVKSIDEMMIYFIIKNDNLDILLYSSLIDGNIDDVLLTANDYKHAVSSCKRYFEEGDFVNNSQSKNDYYKRSIHNCKISKKLAKYIVYGLRPDIFITSNGIYSTWGPCFDYVKTHGVKSLVFDFNVHYNKRILILDTIWQRMSEDSDWKKFKDHELTVKQKNLVEKVFDSRINHAAQDTSIYYSNVVRGGSQKLMDVKKGKITYGIFPNVIWDGDISDRDIYFEGVIDWIISTVKYVREKTNNNIIIRFHPAESTMHSGSLSMYAAITRKAPGLLDDENIQIIKSEDAVDSYTLARRFIDIGLVYSGTMALELTYMGIPVLSPANSFYNNVKITIPIQSRSEYMNLLIRPDLILKQFEDQKPEIMKNLYTFAYWYFIHNTFEIPIISEKKIYRVRFDQIKSSDEIDPRTNGEILRLINKIENYV